MERKATILLKTDETHDAKLLERFKKVLEYNGFQVEDVKEWPLNSFQTSAVPSHYKGSDNLVVLIGVSDRYNYGDLRRPAAERYNVLEFKNLEQACEA